MPEPGRNLSELFNYMEFNALFDHPAGQRDLAPPAIHEMQRDQRVRDDEQAQLLARLFDTNKEVLFRFFERRGVPRDKANDLIQACFLTLWRNRENVAEAVSPHYLFGIARMLVSESWRRMVSHSGEPARGQHVIPQSPPNQPSCTGEPPNPSTDMEVLTLPSNGVLRAVQLFLRMQ